MHRWLFCLWVGLTHLFFNCAFLGVRAYALKYPGGWGVICLWGLFSRFLIMVRIFYFALFLVAGLWMVSAAADASSAATEPTPETAEVDTDTLFIDTDSVGAVADSFMHDAKEALTSKEVTAYRAFAMIKDPAVTILPAKNRMATAYDALLGYNNLTLPTNEGRLAEVRKPHSRSYLRVTLTTSSEVTYKVLPRGGKDIVGIAYTVGDSATVRDSELRFYDERFRPIALKRVMTPLRIEDFFDFRGVEKGMRGELMALLPFMAVEYSFSPDNEELRARLTAVEALSREDQQRLAPYLRSPLLLVWDGGKYRRMDK